MCGLFGAIRLRGGMFGPADYDRFAQLTDLVHYRGPDDSGYECIDTRTGERGTRQAFDVFLGHRRLSILDTSSKGHQPFTDGGSDWLIYNGEVFNYIELREDLRAAGVVFDSGADTEVILHYMRRNGAGSEGAFNGMWAFVQLDLRRRQVLFSRDRFGIKPLYLLRDGDDVYFASEMKQLLPLIRDVRADREVLLQFLARGVAHDGARTFFERIEAFPTRHSAVLDLDTGGWTSVPYWAHRTDLPIAEDAELSTFRELFMDAVRIRLRADVPLGVLLSGGLDSSAITVGALQSLPQGLDAYSMVVEGDAESEERFIDALAAKPGLRIHKLQVTPSGLSEALEEALWHTEAPHTSLTFLSHYMLMRKVREETDIVVMLSGQGGDELLMGYRKYFFFALMTMLKQGRVFPAASLLVQSLYQGTVARQFSLADAQRYLPGAGSRPFLRETPPRMSLGVGTSLVQRQIADIDRFSVPLLTHYEDRSSMAGSIEIRLPFLDHRLVELMTSMADRWKLRGGWTKYVLREAMTELPPAIRWRRDKQAFQGPYRRWMAENFAPAVTESFQHSMLSEMGLVNDSAVLSALDGLQQGDRSVSPHEVARVYLAERWAQRFLRGER